MRVYLLLVILLFSACRVSGQNETLFTLPNQWPVPDSISNKIKQRIEKGDVEYFSINGTQFRFLKYSRANNMFGLEVKMNDQWIPNLSMPMPRETFFLTQDFDLDNCYDLFFLDYGKIKLYFFDKTNRSFRPEPMQFSYDYALLDSSKLIYGANNHIGANWDIDIFSIKDRKKTFLYKSTLFLKSNSNNGGFEISNGLLYKCRNGIEADTLLIDKFDIHRQFGDFSLLQFMKDLAHDKVYR